MREIIAIIIITLSIFLLVSSVLYLKKGLGKWFYHDILEWHIPDDHDHIYKFDGLNAKAICKYCGQEIIQDSQGNWF